MTFNAMRYSYRPKEIDKFDVDPMIDRFRQGEADGNQRRIKNAMIAAGGEMATGNTAGAKNALYRAGEIDGGMGIQNHADRQQELSYSRGRRAVTDQRADTEWSQGQQDRVYGLKRRRVADGRADAEYAEAGRTKAAALYGNLYRMAGGDPKKLKMLEDVARSAGFEIPAEFSQAGGGETAVAVAGGEPLVGETVVGEEGVEQLFGSADNLQASILSGNFDQDFQTLLQRAKPEHQLKLWLQGQRIKQQVTRSAQAGQLPMPAAGGAPQASAPGSVDEQRLARVAAKFAGEPTAQRNAMFKLQAAANTIEKDLQRLKALVQQDGYAMVPGLEKDRIGQELTNLKMSLKELHELGALVGADFTMLDAMLMDPRIDGPVEALGAAGAYMSGGGDGSQRMAQSITGLIQQINARMKARGLEPIEDGVPASSPGAPQVPQSGGAPGGDYSQMTDDEILRQLGP